MADEKEGQEKSIEMRVAELEDKLAQVHITEEELKAYHKVSALIAGQGAGTAAASCGGCISECGVMQPIRQPIVYQCIQCIIRQCIRPIIRQPIIQQCYECFDCAPGPVGGQLGGQFGGFGG